MVDDDEVGIEEAKINGTKDDEKNSKKDKREMPWHPKRVNLR